MMAGGLFMLGFGLIAMLFVVGLPVALIAVLIWALARRRDSSIHASVPFYQSKALARTCKHCGTTLQSDWSNCPHCGAAI